MKNSHIEWTDHTFNPWIGCTKVSPGCAHCYAEALNKRWKKGENWGKGASRVRTSAAYWKQPLQWNAEAENYRRCLICGAETDFGVNAEGFCDQCEQKADVIRPRVFCASLADWLDDEVPIEWLADLLKLIHDTPNLDWLLLTKRPQNWADRIAAVWKDCDAPFLRDWEEDYLVGWLEGRAPDNIRIGTSVENQEMADERIPNLLEIPARVRFLSCEPLLEEVDLYRVRGALMEGAETCHRGIAHDERKCDCAFGVDWVICGGESGPGARPMHPDWARSLRDQCQAAGVPFFFKQWGEWYPLAPGRLVGFDSNIEMVLPDASEYDRKTLAPENAQPMIRDGKRVAGRELDGREWNELPKAEVPA